MLVSSRPLRAFRPPSDNPLSPGILPLRIILLTPGILPPPDIPLTPDNPPPPGIPPPPSKKAAISPLNTCKHFKQLGAMALGGNEHIDASRQFAGVAG